MIDKNEIPKHWQMKPHGGLCKVRQLSGEQTDTIIYEQNEARVA